MLSAHISVTVASAERSFSKLKLLKNCLRSTMLQERLNGLAMCSIENDILDTIDLESVLEDFASRNTRRRFFKKHWSTVVLFEVTIIVILPFFYLLCCTVTFSRRIKYMLQVIYFNRPIQILHYRALSVLLAQGPIKFVGRPWSCRVWNWIAARLYGEYVLILISMDGN